MVQNGSGRVVSSPRVRTQVLSELVGVIKRSAPVAVLTGAGVSRESGIPLGGEVVGLLQRSGLVSSSVGDYPTAIAHAFRGDDKARGAFIRSICHGRSAGPANQIIGRLAQEFGVSTLLTTNFDHLLEQSCLSGGSRPVATSLLGSPFGSSSARDSKAIHILKLHGDAHFNQTAHSEAEMSRHHAWLQAWSQLSIDAGTTLLVLGQAGGDGPLQSLLLSLVASGKVAHIVWTMFSDSIAPPHLEAWAHDVRTAGGRVSFVGPTSAESFVSDLIRGLTGADPVISRLLLPGHQVCTGLVQGAGQVDRDSIAAQASLDVVRRLRRIVPANSRVAIRTDHKTETVFRAAAALIRSDRPSFLFAFDQADNLPVSMAFAKSLVAFVAECTGQVFEPLEAHLAVCALAGTEANLLVTLSSAMVDSLVLGSIDRIGSALPSDCVMWVVLEEGREKPLGFKEVRFNQPVALLPSDSSGLLFHTRISFEESDFETILRHEGRKRTVDELVTGELVFRRGGHIVVEHSRWSRRPIQMPDQISAALEEIGAEKDAIARLTVLGELENVYFQASRGALSSRNVKMLQRAAAVLLECANWWSGPIGTAYFIQTMIELSGPDDLFAELRADQVSQLIRILDQWPPDHRFEWLGKPVQFLMPGIQRIKRQLDRIVLGADSGLSASSPDNEILDQMRVLEGKWTGGAWLLPGWLLTVEAKASPEGLDRYKALIALAEKVSDNGVMRDVNLDDLARYMTTFSVEAAVAQWEKISLSLCERGGTVASIHARVFSQALLAIGDLESASALIYEAIVHAARNGDLGRAWLCVKDLHDLAESGQYGVEEATQIEAWALHWLAAIGEEHPERDTGLRLEKVIGRRGLTARSLHYTSDAKSGRNGERNHA